MRASPHLLLACILVCQADMARADATRFSASLQTTYNGTHPDLFNDQQDHVRLLVRQVQLEVSARLGLLQYQEGFRCPLTVRFSDGAPGGVEFALAYVRLYTSGDTISQEMVVNLDEFARTSTEFDHVFTHEMTHAVINDALPTASLGTIPGWVQEGLATYMAGEGEARVQNLAQHFHRSTVARAVHDFDARINGIDYAQDYLVFRYLYERYSVNAVEAFVRDLIQGKNPQDALEDSTGVPLERFRQDLRAYTLAAYQDKAKSDFEP